MTREDNETLDDLLSRWHDWQERQRLTRGHRERSLVCGDYRGSRQYDAENGALDDAQDDQRSAIVDEQVDEMTHPWRTAIYVQARNLCTGRIVWSSPRLPSARAELEVVVLDARRQLSNRLRSAGVM